MELLTIESILFEEILFSDLPPELINNTAELEPEERGIFEGLDPVPQALYRAKGKGVSKAKKCEKGQVCGLSCIAKTKVCRKNLTESQKPKAKKSVSKTKSKGGGGITIQDQLSAQDLEQVKGFISQANEMVFKEGVTDAQIERLSASASVWKMIQATDAKDPGNSAFVVNRASDGTLESVAKINRFTSDSIEIDYLATNPKNLIPGTNGHRRGSGTETVVKVLELAQTERKSVRLFSLPNAQPFYEKLGFTLESPRGMHKIEPPDITATLAKLQPQRALSLIDELLDLEDNQGVEVGRLNSESEPV